MPRPLLALLAATAVSYPLGLAIGSRWLLPVLNAAPAWLVMARLLRRGRRKEAVLAMLAWAGTLAVVGTVSFRVWPTDPGPCVLLGPDYRAEMFHWISTGEGREGDPAQFLPQHLGHLAAFVIACLATASTVSITLGAVLMNYMDYYVASLGRAGAPTWAVALLGWQPWALCRVAAFSTLGAVLAEPLLCRVLGYAYPGLRSARPYLAWAAAGIAADWALKAALAPLWRAWLRVLLP